MNIPPMEPVRPGACPPQSSLERKLEEQTKSINSLAESITKLANSNAMIAQALVEQIDDDGEDTATAYLDGQPLG